MLACRVAESNITAIGPFGFPQEIFQPNFDADTYMYIYISCTSTISSYALQIYAQTYMYWWSLESNGARQPSSTWKPLKTNGRNKYNTYNNSLKLN